IATLASKLDGSVPKSFTELCARLKALASTESYQQFDAAVRESYSDAQTFGTAFEQYAKARKLRDRSLEVCQAKDSSTQPVNWTRHLNSRASRFSVRSGSIHSSRNPTCFP